MDDDETRALRWLLGRGNETDTTRTVDGGRIVHHVGEADGRAALVRVLCRQEPLNRDLQNVLANAFVLPGSSAMCLKLYLTRRKNGRPANDVKNAVEQTKLGKSIEEAAASPTGGKEWMVAEKTAKADGKGRTTGFKALAKRETARQLRNEK
jgi:hypothetical protein